MEIPAVSVIIPMYNVEKYIGECLDSLLAQTVKNFEVIVVDDCSTDNSAAIVESYLPKFNGRLRLSRMKKNSGNAGFPRNKGIELSCGEYVFFLDSDDTITLTALDELYPLAKSADVDIIHCQRYWQIPEEFWHDTNFRNRLRPYSYKKGKFLTEPPMITTNIVERAFRLRNVDFIWNAGGQIVKRAFLVENEIKFCDSVNEDLLFTMKTLCLAKRYVVVPNVFYNYRRRKGSIMSPQLNPAQILHRQVKSLKNGIKYLDEFLSGIKIFSERPYLKYMFFEMFSGEILGHLSELYLKVPPPAFDEILRKEFGGENAALSAFIFSSMNIYRLELMGASKRIAELENELQRIR